MKSLLRSGFLLTCLTVGCIGSLQAQNTFPATGNVGIGISPMGSLDVVRGTAEYGTAVFRGTGHASHFNYSTAENTYIRGGKIGSTVLINDSHNGHVSLAAGGGQVGIGIATSAAPAYRLHIANGAIGGNYGLTPTYANWAVYGTGDGGAAIYNDNNTFKKLMIVGNTSAGGVREVGIWDNLTVDGNSSVSGNSSVNGNSFVNGNVGIGTSTPSAPLSFGSTLGNSKLALWDDGTNRYGLGIQAAQFRFHLGGAGARFFKSNGDVVLVSSNNATSGNVGIGTTLTTNPNGYKLAVNGTIGAKAVKVETSSTTWADYVFLPTYRLRPLSEVESYIKVHSHLPEVPSAAEVEKNGHDLGQMDATLLQKIEELTLYMIEQSKQIKELTKENDVLKARIIRLEAK